MFLLDVLFSWQCNRSPITISWEMQCGYIGERDYLLDFLKPEPGASGPYIFLVILGSFCSEKPLCYCWRVQIDFH